MIWVIVALAGIVLLVVRGWTQHLRALANHHGSEYIVWRWFSGGLPPWIRDEKDRRYRHEFDPGSQHYHIKARLHRAAVRTGWTLGIPLLGIALLLRSRLIWVVVIGIAAMLVAEAVIKLRAADRVRTNRKIAKQVHQAAAPYASRPLRGNPGQWIKFTDDKRQQVRAELPKNWNGTEQARTRLVQVMTETLGYHAESSAEWHLTGGDSHVVITNQKAPPEHVELRDIEPFVEKNDENRVTLGLGRGNTPVNVSLAEDSPHFGLSVGAGGGKSQLARLAAAQVLHNGGNVLLLDPKRISHAWARDLPNVRYARTTEEIHAALIWLAYEVDRRTKVADAGHNVEGEVLANVGPRLLVIAEELNEMSSRLRQHWLEIRPSKGAKKSPAIQALETALFMGRQVKVNILAVAQMMTALAAGSGAARENMGVRILGRYTRNNWRMLVPEFDLPSARSMRPGRVQVVTHKVTECQVAFLSGLEARDLAISGKVTPFPPDPFTDPVIPEAVEVVPDDHAIPASTTESSDHEVVDAPRKVILSEAAGTIVPRTLKALRNAAFRDPDFPDHVDVRTTAQGHPKEYWEDEIVAWHEKKMRQGDG